MDRAGLALDHTYHLQKLHVDRVSKSRSVADGGSLRSVARGPPGACRHGSVLGGGPCQPQAQVLRALVSLGEAEGTQSISVCPTPAMAEETEAEGQTVTFLGPTASRWQG